MKLAAICAKKNSKLKKIVEMTIMLLAGNKTPLAM
jgi:hypothetical protein